MSLTACSASSTRARLRKTRDDPRLRATSRMLFNSVRERERENLTGPPSALFAVLSSTRRDLLTFKHRVREVGFTKLEPLAASISSRLHEPAHGRSEGLKKASPTPSSWHGSSCRGHRPASSQSRRRTLVEESHDTPRGEASPGCDPTFKGAWRPRESGTSPSEHDHRCSFVQIHRAVCVRPGRRPGEPRLGWRGERPRP